MENSYRDSFLDNFINALFGNDSKTSGVLTRLINLGAKYRQILLMFGFLMLLIIYKVHPDFGLILTSLTLMILLTNKI